MSWWSDLLAGPAAAAGSFKVIEGIWTNLRDYKMWRSLGWITLGVILMLFGAALLVRPLGTLRELREAA